MGIPTFFDFEVIDVVEGIPTYPAMVRWPWGWNMKATFSLERGSIKFKGNNRKIVIPLDPRERNPWIEPIDNEVETNFLYQIMQEDKDKVEPNIIREIHTRSPISIR